MNHQAVDFQDAGFVCRSEEGELITFLLRPHLISSQERLILLAFDQQQRLTAAEEMGGTHSRSAVLAPSAVRRILAVPASAWLIVAHNHPSGCSGPSRTDIAFTKRMLDLCGLVGLTLFDHLILTGKGHFSFRTAGLL